MTTDRGPSPRPGASGSAVGGVDAEPPLGSSGGSLARGASWARLTQSRFSVNFLADLRYDWPLAMRRLALVQCRQKLQTAGAAWLAVPGRS